MLIQLIGLTLTTWTDGWESHYSDVVLASRRQRHVTQWRGLHLGIWRDVVNSRQHGSHTLMFLNRCLLTAQSLHFVASFTPAACFTDCNLLGVVATRPRERPCWLTLICLFVYLPLSIEVCRFLAFAYAYCSCIFHPCVYLGAHILRRTNANVYRCGLAHSPHPSLYFHNIFAYIHPSSNYLAIYNRGRLMEWFWRLRWRVWTTKLCTTVSWDVLRPRHRMASVCEWM